jgi:hypothetical protein
VGYDKIESVMVTTAQPVGLVELQFHLVAGSSRDLLLRDLWDECLEQIVLA